MKILYQIVNIGCGFAITDENGKRVSETATYGDFDWAKITLIKLAHEYFLEAKERSEVLCQEMSFGDMEILADKVILKGVE